MKSTTWVCKSLAVLTGVFVASLAGLPASAQVSNSAASVVTVAVPARVTQAVDNSKLVPLKGGVSPLAQAQFDRGAVAPGFAPGHLLLLLQRSGEQQAALHKLMFSQIDRASPNFHAWLTPEQFGTRFGPADSDVQAVTSWMQSQGLQVFGVNKGKTAVEFTGTAAALQKAFHSPIHQFAMNGKTYWSNTSALQIPAALAPVIRGVRLNNLSAPRPLHHVAGAFSKSLDTGRIQALNTAAVTHSSPCTGAAGSSCFAIGPADFATIYNVLPLWNGTAPATARIDGTGQSIAVLGTSNISLSDVANFRTLFGLPTAGAAVPQVVIDGEDPGIVNDQGQETEALTDVEWAGAVAKNAQIHLVVAIPSNDHSSGIELAALRVVDNNSDPIIEISFSDCEANNDTVMQDLEVFWEQAAAQGITVVAAAGDAGSAGCSDPSQPAPNPATQGLQVNGIASTPFNIAVGGTDFNDAGAQATYFNAVATPGAAASAKSYIPETTWNDSCTNAVFGADPEANCNSTTPPANAAIVTLGSGGGLSTLFTEPDFQAFISAANGMPGGARALPDVSLFAGDGFPGAPAGQSSGSFYVLCQADSPLITSAASSCQGATPQFVGVGGTSVSSAAFAGIMALVNQQQGGRQGNANFVLYKLAQLQFTAGAACTSQASPLPDATCVFNDIATGNNAQPCVTNSSADCATNLPPDANGVLSGFSAGAGYDAATGLGSVNAANLVTRWQNGLTAFIPTQTTLQLNGQSAALNGINVGDNVSVAVTVTPSSGTQPPSGDIALLSASATQPAANGPGVAFTLTPSSTDNTSSLIGVLTDQLTANGGVSYKVNAHYGGDGVYAPSDSNDVTVSGVTKTASSATTFLLNTLLGTFPPQSGTVISPAGVILTAQIAGNNPNNIGGGPVATGTVDFLDNGTVVATAVPLNQTGEAFHATPVIFTAGDHSIVAHYNGDASYNPSDSAAVPFTVAAPAFNLTAAPATVTAGATGPSVVTITPTNAFTGTVAVSCSGTLPPGVTCAPANINVTNGAVATGNLNFTVAGPSTTLTASAFPARSESLPAHHSGWMFASATTGFFAVLLLFLPGRKRLRAILSLGLVSLLSLAIGCNSSSNQNSGPAASTTKLTVTSSKVPSTNANGFQVTVNVTGGSVTPSGQVQIFDQTTNTTAPPVALTNGSANINLTLTVGTHTVIAQYLGDSKHNTSQSGALSLTTTGTAQITITANPVANGPASVALTIN